MMCFTACGHPGAPSVTGTSSAGFRRRRKGQAPGRGGGKQCKQRQAYSLKLCPVRHILPITAIQPVFIFLRMWNPHEDRVTGQLRLPQAGAAGPLRGPLGAALLPRQPQRIGTSALGLRGGCVGRAGMIGMRLGDWCAGLVCLGQCWDSILCSLSRNRWMFVA